MSTDGELENYPANCVILDVSELVPSNIISCLRGQFDEATLQFTFIKQPGYLETALNEKKDIVLKGSFTREVAVCLHALLIKRLT